MDVAWVSCRRSLGKVRTGTREELEIGGKCFLGSLLRSSLEMWSLSVRKSADKRKRA